LVSKISTLEKCSALGKESGSVFRTLLYREEKPCSRILFFFDYAKSALELGKQLYCISKAIEVSIILATK